MVISAKKDNLLDAFSGVRNSLTIQRRIQWMEDRLYWIGELNRSDLVTRFSISQQQASSDIRQYQELAPANISYDKSRKLYSRSADFAPLFSKSSEDWLADNRDDVAALRSISSESVQPIKRGVAEDIVRAICSSYRLRKPIAILYHSTSDAAPSWQPICPHSFVETEIRWHIRAWVANIRKFADIVPGRILQCRDYPEGEWIGGEADEAWNSMAEIVLVPSAQLSQAQKTIVERDYEMRYGKKVIVTRKCLVYYQLSAMYLVDAVREHDGEPRDRNFGVAVENWQSLLKYVTGPESARPI